MHNEAAAQPFLHELYSVWHCAQSFPKQVQSWLLLQRLECSDPRPSTRCCFSFWSKVRLGRREQTNSLPQINLTCLRIKAHLKENSLRVTSQLRKALKTANKFREKSQCVSVHVETVVHLLTRVFTVSSSLLLLIITATVESLLYMWQLITNLATELHTSRNGWQP